jgi:hypothetical protein
MMLARYVLALAALGATAASVAACGGVPANAGDAVRPKDGRGDEALGQAPALEACAPGPAESFVVDLESNQRSDLELAMKDGLAVVSYDCKSLKILKDCRVKGTYAYAGVTPKEDVVKLSSKDEVAANLPVGGAKLSAGLERGKTIDIALITVGKQRSTRKEAIKKDLEGECTGATHVVRGAYVGAYALSSGTVGEVRAAAQMFGVGAEGQSRTEKQIGKSDGNPTICKDSKRSATSAPEACGAALRIELVPVTETRKDEAAAREADQAEKDGKVALSCPAGFGPVGGKCVKGAKADPLGCYTNAPQCNDACDKGNGRACDDLAHYWYGRRIDADGKETRDNSAKDTAKADAYFHKACDAAYGHACSFLAMMAKDPGEARKYEDSACDGGYAYSCWVLVDRESDPAKQLDYARRGCDLGYGTSCGSYGQLLVDASKLDEADKAFAKGCCAGDFGAGDVCLAWGNVYATGMRTKVQYEKAFAAYTKGCDVNFPLACHAVGTMIARGLGTAADPARARSYFERGCDPKAPGWDACFTLGEMYEQGKGGAKDLAKAADTYALGCAKGACARAGALYEKGAGGKPDLAKAQAAYNKGCQRFGHVDACFGGARLLEKSDKATAKDKLTELCTRTKLDAVCKEAKKVGAKLPGDLKTVKELPPPGPNCRTPFTCTDAEFEAYKKDWAAHRPKK